MVFERISLKICVIKALTTDKAKRKLKGHIIKIIRYRTRLD